jgi:hypothetical protein
VPRWRPPPPEPLASVVGYLGDDLTRRTFVPTAELLTALGVEATAFGRDMGALECNLRPGRITDPDGSVRQVRGYLTADLRAAVERHRGSCNPSQTRHKTRHTPAEPVTSGCDRFAGR